ncbi:MAG TPA: amino acid ABC transporter substrate-binding protein [Streptosporangiaceae bacterium]
MSTSRSDRAGPAGVHERVQAAFAEEIPGAPGSLTGPHRSPPRVPHTGAGAAVAKAGNGLSSAKIINCLHGGVPLPAVAGPGEAQRRRDERRCLDVHPPVADGARFAQVLPAGPVAIANPSPPGAGADTRTWPTREDRMMRRPSVTAARAAAVTILAAASVAACGVGSVGAPDTATSGELSGTPITVGVSLSLSGGSKADGQACLRGYQLWAADVNSNGGLLGRPVKLVVLDDKGNLNTARDNYTTLITARHVDLTLGPSSSQLTIPAAQVARRYGYALVEGAGTSPAVYATKMSNLFGVSAPAAQQLVPFANWVASLLPGQRPKTAAYAMVDDPVADPQVQAARVILERAGITTVYNNATAPYRTTTKAALTADADQVRAASPQIVVIGSVGVPTVAAFINEFRRLSFNPQMIIATAGPDQGQAFLKAIGASRAIGASNADGIMVPATWSSSSPNALSHVMVQEYVAQYGDAPGISGDVAQAYSAGQVIADAVQSVGLSQSKIIAFLHSSGAQVDTVQGPAAWGRYEAGKPAGENVRAEHFIFQWQAGGRFVRVLSSDGQPSPDIEAVKPVWTTG